MTIAYRGGGQNAALSVNSLVVTMSTTAQNGDYLIALAAHDIATASTYTWPSGFTERGKVTSTVDGGTFAWADNIGGASEPSTYTIAVDNSGSNFAVGVVAYSGGDTTTPRDVTPTSNSLGTQASPWDVTATGVATGSANRLLIWMGSTDNTSLGTVTSAVPAASPATWTERLDTSDTNWVNLAVCDCPDTAGTYTSDVTGVQTLGTSNGGRMAFLIALRALSSGTIIPLVMNQFRQRSN